MAEIRQENQLRLVAKIPMISLTFSPALPFWGHPRTRLQAMMSVVKLGDPVLAVHPVLITLCDVMWILGLAGEGFLECGL